MWRRVRLSVAQPLDIDTISNSILHVVFWYVSFNKGDNMITTAVVFNILSPATLCYVRLVVVQNSLYRRKGTISTSSAQK